MTTLPRLEIAVTGPAVGEGRMAIDDLALIARSIEKALVRIAEATMRGDERRRGRKPRVVAETCRLFLVGWRSGSAVATFEAGRTEELFNEVADRSLERLMEGFAWLAQGRTREDARWRAFAPAIGELRQLGSVFRRGIERIELGRPDRAGPPAVYDAVLHDILSAAYAAEPETRRLVVVGRLDRLDGHEGLTGMLWEFDGTSWLCVFRPTTEEELARFWRRQVAVEGVATVPLLGGRRTLAVETIRLVDWPREAASRRFWTGASLQDLAREQAVKPIGDADELLAVWGGEQLETDPFEELMAERRRRRVSAELG